MDMLATTPIPRASATFLAALQDLPFIQKVSFARALKSEARADSILSVHAGTKRFDLNVIQKLSYLDRATLHSLIAQAAASKRPLLLFARYIPRESGDQLIKAGINFVDQAGNVHVQLERRYAHTILGRPQTQKPQSNTRVTAAQVQVWFAYAAEPNLLARPVRDIATQAGISKSKAAVIRQQLLAQNRSTPRLSATGARSLPERLLHGYSSVLRPKLLIGRFRAPEASTDEFLNRLRRTEVAGLRFSLTGGPAADRLQHYYRGSDLPLFVANWSPEVRQQWRLLPDRDGPLILLRAFGEVAFWRTIDGLTVAHPWLIYAELMDSDDPRAHEAAEELRREHLPQ